MNFTQFLEKQWKLLVGAIALVFVGGAVATVINMKSKQNEILAQESYFAAEKKLLDIKNKKNPQTTGKEAVTAAPADYTLIKTDLENVMNKFSGSVASQMAAIQYVSILVEEKNFDLALSTLKNVETKSTGLVNTLVQQQIGQLLADKKNCIEAIPVWQKIVDRKEAAFIHGETKIQQALCHIKINNLTKAEEILTNLANQTANPDMAASSVSKDAEKYLKLLLFKKASGG